MLAALDGEVTMNNVYPRVMKSQKARKRDCEPTIMVLRREDVTAE
jgi:hypothetical protein